MGPGLRSRKATFSGLTAEKQSAEGPGTIFTGQPEEIGSATVPNAIPGVSVQCEPA